MFSLFCFHCIFVDRFFLFLFFSGFVVCDGCSKNKRHTKRICDNCFIDHQSGDILDTVDIRLALLRNYKLIEYINDNKLKRNIDIILKIVLRGQEMDENVMTELIIFITKLFTDIHDCRDIALQIIGQQAMNNKDLKNAMKEGIKRGIETKQNLSDRICMFLCCEEFYKLYDIHQYFVELLNVKNDDEIQKWNPDQIEQIQNLTEKYTQKRTGIKLWDSIYNKLIKLPIDPLNDDEFIETAPAANGGFVADAWSALGGILKQEEKKQEILMDVDEEEKVATFSMEGLEFCLSMADWVKFAAKMKQIGSLQRFIQFVESNLKRLDECILRSAKCIDIQSLEVFKGKQMEISRLIKDCGYDKIFDEAKLRVMIDGLNTFINFKQHLIRFLTRFTRQNEDDITKQTLDFVNFIKNWDLKSYIEVKSRPEWRKWLKPNSVKLEFLYNIQASNVFYNIWCSERRKISESHNPFAKVWNFENYLNILYPQAKKEWDNLVKRASKSRLTFNDIIWFKGFELEQELRIMNIASNKIRDTQKDIEESLRIDKYVEFVENLTKIVDIFIFKGNTKIRNNKDQDWIKLKNNLKKSKQKKMINHKIYQISRNYIGILQD